MSDQNFSNPILAALLPGGRIFDRVYGDAIVPCSTEIGLEPRRVTAEFSDPARWLRMKGEISRAECVVADLTAKNPNVFYQTGYAHAAGRRVVLIAQHAEDLPFPASHAPVLIYSGNTAELTAQLRVRLRELSGGVAHPKAGDGKGLAADTAREQFFKIFGDLFREHGAEHRGGIRIENEKTFVLENQDLELALVQALARRARELGLRLKLL